MRRGNLLYMVVGGLAAAVAVLGYLLYEERQSRVHIEVPGVEIEAN